MAHIIEITSPEQWHQTRRLHVGGSDVAALFGKSPYLTRFELWHQKQGNVADQTEDTEYSFWGKRLEGAIAEGIAERHGWKIEKPKGYYVHHKVKGMGCTPDCFILPPVEGYEGMGVFQIKNVSWLEFRDSWINDTPPLKYLLQLQHEIACTNLKWGAIGALIGGNEGQAFPYPRHDGAIRRIEAEVKGFWDSIEQKNEPAAVAEDYGLIRRMYKPNGAEIDLSTDKSLPALCADANKYREIRLDAQRQEELCKAQIIQKLKGAVRGWCQDFIIDFTEHSDQMQAKDSHTRNYRRLTIKETNI